MTLASANPFIMHVVDVDDVLSLCANEFDFSDFSRAALPRLIVALLQARSFLFFFFFF